jgi:GTPase SAR1 family protein
MSSEASVEITKYRVVLLGDAGVGKTALVSQFMTSEYMNTYDASLGKVTYVYVYVCIYNGWATRTSPCIAIFEDLLCFPF